MTNYDKLCEENRIQEEITNEQNSIVEQSIDQMMVGNDYEMVDVLSANNMSRLDTQN